MILRKCDRCGELYENYLGDGGPRGIATIVWENFTDYGIYDTYDLCDECVKDFKTFMKDKE